MRSMCARPLAAVAAWCIVSAAALAQGTLDPIDVAVTVSGAVRAERGERNTNFFISSNIATVMVSVLNEFAFSPAPNDTLSYQWARQFAAPRMSIQFGDVREDRKTSAAMNDVMMCFTDPAPERSGDQVSYLLQCVAWDTPRALKREGAQVVEMAVVIDVKAGAPADVYLGKTRPQDAFIYVRLQN